MPRQAAVLAALALQHKRRLLPWLLVLLAGLAALLYMKYAMAATFTVTSTADTGGSTCSGTCTLRQAINAANAAGVGPHTINFNISGCSSGCTITVTASTPLPALTRPVNINGASQPGYSGAPLIRVHGDSYYFLLFFYSVDIGLELATGSSGSTIRGLALTNFQSHGILVSSSNNLIAGNYVGTDLTGNAAVGNDTGIWLSSGSGNTVGGTTAADRNVISGNTASGVYITSNSNVVIGNYIGLGANGSTALGNAHAGIWLTAVANNNRLGGVNAVDANTLANNAEDGITFQAGGSSSGNSILRNAIFNNGQRGIDFNNDGVTANDAGDGDSGPNGLQNFPVVSTAVTNGTTTTVTGSLNSNANTSYRIEFFSNATGDGSGYGEGQVYLGTTTVTTNGSGNATYSQALAVATTVGHKVSAIATVDLGGGTYGSSSEFALNATVALTPAGVTASAISGNTTEAGGTATFTVVLDRAPTANVTITLSSSNTTEGTVSPASLTFTTANWSTPQTVTVTGQDETIVDGDRAYTIVLGAATSADTAYNGLNPADVAVTNTDNDTQSTIVVTTTSDVVDGNTSSLYALLTNKGADGQISLREAITAANNSANGSGGADRIHFAIALGAAGFTGTNGVNGRWVITLASALPQITDSVIIDATTQTTAVADSNPGTLGTGGTVGTDGLALSTVNRPEVEIVGSAAMTMGFDVAASNVTLRGFAIRGFGTTGSDTAINIGNNFTGTLIEQNVLGSNAISFTDPGAGQRNWRHIVINGADSGTVQNNLFGFSSSNSLEFGNTSTNWLISNNEFRDSGFQVNGADAIAMGASTSFTIQRNLITGTSGQAMAAGTSSSITFVNNTVTGSGTATTGGSPTQTNTIGIRNTASAITLDRNIITGNYGAGVSVNNGAAGVRITQNSIYNNGTITSRNGSAASGQIGIDLNNSTDDSFLGTAPFFTLNDSGDGDAGGNNLQNFPVLATARTNASNQLVLTGSLNSNANSFFRLEFFASTSQHASGYGVGQRYLGALDIATDGSGNATISTTLTTNVAVGEFISATATRSVAGYGSFTDTSEFSRTIAAVSSSQATLTVDTNTDVLDGDTTSISTLLANKGADGFISLREAITAANNTANGTGGPDIINFAVGTGSFSIGLGSSLPALSQAKIINGWSQPGYVSSPLVIIDCNQNAAIGLQLAAGAGGSTVRGLVIRDCSSHAMQINSGSNGNTIHGNYLGSYGAAGNDLGVGEQNVGAGIFVAGANNFIGGGGTGQGNVIGGNQSNGVQISGAAATGNRVQGNYIGMNAAGNAAVANTGAGIRVESSATGTIIGTNLDGSNDATEGNVVSGNGGIGIVVGANNTVVQGNYVGLLPDGATKLANASYGIDVLPNVTSVTIGGATAGAGNVISGNGNAGIIFEVGSSGSVKGNLVGTSASGTSVITGIGAALYVATTNLQIGGTTTAEGNIFAGSNTDGIIVAGATSTGNAILGNRIYSNTGLGIDLVNDGVTANDTGDADTGPNNLQNFPVLTTAITNGAGTQVTITGSLNSVANTNFRIEFFASTTADPSGYGEGQRYLGSTNVTTNALGNAAFSGVLAASVAAGESISATATKANAGYTVYSDTSEFSANVVAALPPYTVSGTVYEDVNYGGGAGRTLAASSGVGVSGATVELYSADTGLMATTTTNGSGAYSFAVGNGGYFVRVVQSTVASTRSGSTAALRAVQTWRQEASWLTPAAVTNEVGGARPDVADSSAAAALSWSACAAEGATCTFTGTRLVRYGLSPNFTTRVATGSVACDNATFGDPAAGFGKACAVLQPNLHSASSVHIASANTSGVDFGFNFSTVTNVNDSGAGSLRQAITNANTLPDTGLAQSGRTAGIESLVFMISNGTTGSGGSLGLSGGLRTTENLFSSGVATITPTSTLPTLSTPMVVDAQAQPGWTANPLININGASAGGGNGLTVTGGNTVLRGLAVRGWAGAWGITINGSSANTLEGCWVGLNAAGTAAAANGQGVWIDSSTNNMVGGTTSAKRNVLSGNTSNGLVLNSATGTVIKGNYFGLNAAGTAAVANGDSGIVLLGTSTGTVIGGTVAGEGNFIAGNTGLSGGAAAGVSIQVSTATGSVIRGNVFGMNATQSATIATGGFGIYAPAANTTIGGTTAGAGNVITAHSLDGIAVVGATTSAVTIQGNSIYGNTGIGIDLADNGATANDGAKTAGQPNLLMDAPVFTSATMSGTTMTVAGYVGSTAGQSTFASSRVEVFVSDNSSASGQGQTYLGFVTTDASGNFSGAITGVTGITVNTTKVTGTATDGSGNTSEFGANITVSLGISGTVFEDVNYGGGAGRTLAASAGAGLAGATVELYSSAGVWVSSTTSTSGGAYSFTGLTAGTYHVRVVNSTVLSQRSGSSGALVGVMTYRTTAATGTAVAVADQVGGTNPSQVDAAVGSAGATFNTTTGVFSAVVTGTAQSYAPVVLGAGDIGGVDFGFNFSTVVNTNNTGQGSLRQAITNANALANTGLAQSGRTAGMENLVFMISNGTASAGLRSANNYFSGGVASIALTSGLPIVTSPLVLDAQTQPGWVLAPIIELNGTSAGTGASGLMLNAAGSVLRGLVINRFDGEGVVSFVGAGLTIQGNYIGTNAAGSAASPNKLSGIWISQSGGGHQIGGTSAAQRNVISSQTQYHGLGIAGGSGNVVQGNYIGTSADGTAALGNTGNGILILGSVSNSTLGGTVAGAGNLIRSNGGSGISVAAGATGVAIQGNSIYGNTGLGIDLNADGISANDGAKTAGQANLLMDSPVFTTATLSGTTLTVAGYVGSAASQSTFATTRVEVFVSDGSFANGQGQTYLGFLTADANGNFSGTITGVTGVVSGTTKITGTATDASGNTSEFGANATVGWGISGTVFEDVNYGGGAGRSQATAAGVGLVGATVELYSSAGVWVRSTTTSGGAYSFSGLATGSYHVRVVGSTVQSQRGGSTGALLGVMTYRTTATTGTAVAVTDQVGGTTPSLADAAAGSAGASFNTTTGVYSAVVTGTAQAYAPVALGTTNISGVDFGFNFNTVVNTNNSGQGSLRQAITNANAFTDDATLAVSGRTAGLEHIIFMLADGTTRAGLRNTFASRFAAGVATITPTSALPSISASLVLDAQTQPGWVQDPIIELRGNTAGAVAGLTLSGGAVTVRGLIINRYGSHGISITGGTAQTVQGCWVGTDATGAAAAANSGAGLSVSSTTSTLQIGGTTAAQRNVISGNSSHGLNIYGGASVVLQGNTIGTSALGTAALANGGRGVWLDSAVTSATVGGTAAGAGNVIAASVDHGLYLGGGATTVQGNFIGTNAAGTAALANANGIYAASTGHQIGGTSLAARNVVSGNTSRGIWLNAGSNTVQGNYVGTNAAGNAALANGDGIYSQALNNTIGGSATGAGNLVSGNTATGVLLNSAADGTTVKGNTIGLNAALGAALANGIGVDLSCAAGCAIGGTATGEGNVISGNTGAGVRVNAASQGNAILGNRIDNNGGLGIDLNGNGVSANDGAKTAGAGNLLMDQPVFISARARGNQLTVAGYVGSAAGQATFANARVEIFSSSQDASGYGEGSTYLGSVTTDASGNFSATITMTASVLAVGTRLTGTATDTSNNTSEFGANFSGLVVDLVVNHNGDGADASPGDGICQTATSGQCTLRAAMQEVNALAAQPNALTIAFALPGCSAAGQAACIITPTTALPALTRAAAIDGQTQPGWTLTPFVELVGSSAPAGTTGLQLQAAGSAVRGLVVGGFDVAGIAISANNATLQGNVIGLQGNGTTTRGNGTTANWRGGVLVTAGTGIVIGGNTAAQRNVISGNGGAGIWLDAGTVTVTGNYIGTTAAGTVAAGNARWGVHIAGGTGHQVGGANTGEGNVVSGHVALTTGGIYVAGSAVTIKGNRIGTNADGSGFLPNGSGLSTFASGIDLRSGSGHVVGGSAAGEANVIAGNQGHGIRVTSQTSRISANSIYSNLWRGIDLNADGVTANDGAVSGAQPNNGMDHAVLTGAGIDGAGTGITVFGYIGTGTGQAVFAGARVEIFKANNDGSGYGQGATYLGYLTADANGRFSGTLAITLGAAVVGDAITATATDASGNTSEFGPNWTSTTVAGLSPAGFNAFESDTANGALTGVIRSKVAGTAATLAVLALDSAGTAAHPAFTGAVQLNWLDARDDTGAFTGSCRATWLDLGAAGTATFTLNNRVDVALTPPATSTKVMRLKMTYTGPSGTVTACSNDAFAALPAQLAWIAASDATSATAGTARTLDNVTSTGGVVHQAGRPFTLRAQALTSGGALMTAYDGTPALTITSCVLPAGCTAGTLGGGSVAASAGLYTHNTVTYSEVGAVALQLTDTTYGNVDAADTAAGTRTFTSTSLQVGRFVPDSYAVTVSTSGVLATANTACLASGSGATFLGQGFGWATAPQVTLTARNAAGATTALWTGSLMKLAPGAGQVPALSVASAGSATLAASYGATAVQDLGAGQAQLQASALDRFVLDAASAQDSTTPTWQWQLAVTDSSEAGTAGNPQPTATATATQASVSFDQGGAFHSARLTLAGAHGDSRSGVRMLMELQRFTSAGWVTMTEDRGCVTVQRSQLEVGTPSGVFTSAGLCAAPLAASATTAGGRAGLALPATPSADAGRLAIRVAGTAASGSACSPAGAVQAVTTLGQPWLTGGSGGAGPQATATWGRPQRDMVLRREIW